MLFLVVSITIFAAGGQISGKVLDEKGETLIGATVMIEGTTNGVKTDLDGKFTLRNVADGKYNLIISYISFDKKTVSDVAVKGGVAEYITITMVKSGKGLKEVVIKTQMKKESINALQIQQKNLTTISDGISAELIKKTPDRNTGDVLKRVSGVSISDNKFAVIRGLADRYNLAMLNGDILPSSEADRKAFSFDIFPSNLLENIVIVKAATPDRPGEFAGGIIDLTTKDIPTENFLNLQLGSGMNTISTFKSYYDSKNSKTDWLGFDKTLRVIPDGFPSQDQLNIKNTIAQNVEVSKTVDNTYGSKLNSSLTPFRNVQISGGLVKNINKESSIGVLAAVSYSRNLRNYTIERNEIIGADNAYQYFDTTTKDNVLIGSLFNIGAKIKNNTKISLKNTFTLNSEDQTIRRQGISYDNEYLVRGSALWFTNNQLLSNQLNVEHVFSKSKIKLQGGVGRNNIVRTTPDLRRTSYVMTFDTQDSLYRAIITNVPSTFINGHYFAKTVESIYSGNFDITVPYTIFKASQTVKAGAYYQSKDREYNARVLGYAKAKTAGFQSSLLTLPEDQIFATENMKDNGFVIKDATMPQDYYTASSKLMAYYLMNDNLLAEKFRFVWGVRIENFSQNLVTGTIKQGDLEVKKQNTSFLPSLNFTYLMNKKTNLRFCASQTLSRPEFRELSPAAFFDFNLSATFTGNPNLEQTRIQNYDLRYEYFMGKGEMVSASLFYKNFINPIELAVDPTATPSQKVFSYINTPSAKSYGLELEFRKTLSFLANNEKSEFNNVTLFGNLSYIKSNVVVEYNISPIEKGTYERPMQGQSPYILNGGISYNHPKSNTSATLVYNRIGQRIFAVGKDRKSVCRERVYVLV